MSSTHTPTTPPTPTAPERLGSLRARAVRRLVPPGGQPPGMGTSARAGLVAGAAVGAALGRRAGALPAAVAGGLAAGVISAVHYAAFSIRAVLHRQARFEDTVAGDLWRLAGLVGAGAGWPPRLDGWTLSPEAAGRLADLVIEHRPATIVDLGSGLSTWVAAAAARRVGLTPRIVSVDEHDAYAERTRRHVPPDADIDVVVCPVTDGWYGPGIDAHLPGRIDLLVVDGPYNGDQQGRRRAALDRLGDRMPPGAPILVDDTHRADERAMVDEWIARGWVELVTGAEDHVVLRRTDEPVTRGD